jgi:nanoRNase/pAp phosphatase (c-di-AMP/oligoRNAs hydrolase)
MMAQEVAQAEPFLKRLLHRTTSHSSPELTKLKLKRLLDAVAEATHVTILLHENPDPDAIGAGLALGHLLTQKRQVEAEIVYYGTIGRPENKALIRYLNAPLQELPEGAPLPSGPIAMVDTQPGRLSSQLQEDNLPAIVIDHHGQEGASQAAFSDIRPSIGSASTILTGYLQAAELEIPERLATALFYGIRTDTKNLSRNATPEDSSAYYALLPLVDAETLAEIEQAVVPTSYFRNLALAMQRARVYGNLIVCDLGRLDYPDLTAEVAELLLRLEEIKWVVCFGTYQNRLHFSTRSRAGEARADQLAQAIAGSEEAAGGHETFAGGLMILNGRGSNKIARQIRERAMAFLGLPMRLSGRPLV